MKRTSFILGAVLLVSCDPSQEEPDTAKAPARVIDRASVGQPDNPSAGAPSLGKIHSLPREKRVAELRLQLMSVKDEDVDLALEEIDRVDESSSKNELLHELALDMEGRADVVRLPMLLAISQDPDASAGLRNTLIADLCREFELSYTPEPAKLAELIEDRMTTPGLE